MAPATLKDVAVRAQVSIRTVSNVVSGYTHVSEKMRLKVLRVIEELDYRPNLVARTLRTGRTGVLALVVPEIDIPYFSELAHEVISAAAEFGYRVMIEQTGRDHLRELALLNRGERTMLFDGILFSPLVTKKQLQSIGHEKTTPIVLLGEHKFDGRFDHVAIDNQRAAQDATEHLIKIGRRRIAAIGEQPLEKFETPQLRTAGYLAALKSARIKTNPQLMHPAVHYRRIDGYTATTNLLNLKDKPDAIFCYSDLLALGALKAVFDFGLRVPDDIAIIGIDNIEEGQYSRPTLSTISLDTQFIAHHAVARAVARIDNPEIEAEEVVAKHSLIMRQSTLGK